MKTKRPELSKYFEKQIEEMYKDIEWKPCTIILIVRWWILSGINFTFFYYYYHSLNMSHICFCFFFLIFYFLYTLRRRSLCAGHSLQLIYSLVPVSIFFLCSYVHWVYFENILVHIPDFYSARTKHWHIQLLVFFFFFFVFFFFILFCFMFMYGVSFWYFYNICIIIYQIPEDKIKEKKFSFQIDLGKILIRQIGFGRCFTRNILGLLVKFWDWIHSISFSYEEECCSWNF